MMFMNRRGSDGAGQTLCTGESSVNNSHLALFCTHQAEAEIVVAVAGRVVVAVGRPQVPRIVVPATATIHAVPARLARQPCARDDDNKDCRNLSVLAWRI